MATQVNENKLLRENSIKIVGRLTDAHVTLGNRKETGEKGSMDRIPYGSSCDYQSDLLYSNVKYDLTCNG